MTDGPRVVIEARVAAVAAKDLDALLACYAEDVTLFDAVGPLRDTGAHPVNGASPAGSTYASPVFEIGSRARTLPAPPHVVWDSLVEPRRPGTRPWLRLLADEVEPGVLTAEKPGQVTWSSLWPSRPDDRIHFALTASSDGGTLLRFTLLTPGEAPDQSKTGHLRRRLNQLLFADLRYSYGQ